MTFEREVRYHVVKIKTRKLVDCVVVEADWPEYEVVWQMIQDRVEGRPNRYEWQPIETAKEANHVLVWLPNYGAVRSIYTLYEGRQLWWNGEHVIYPTHWMPLPAAPKEK